MKKLFFIVISVLICFCNAICVSAATTKHNIDNIKFSLSSEFTVYTGSDLFETSTVEGLVFVAMTESQDHQFQVRCTETEFSKQLKSFYGLDSEIIAPVGNALFENGFETTEISGLNFIKSTSKGDEQYTSIYITVNDSKLYTFTYFGQDATKMGEIMSTVKLPVKNAVANDNIYIIILISVFILADIAFIVFLCVLFVRDYKRRKMETNENVVSQYIKIKRRKF